jgi:predicted transcriptional regulator
MIRMEPLESVSTEIKNKRKAAGLSQQRLSRFVRMSQSTIARLESDIVRLNPSYQTIYGVIDTLDGILQAEQRGSLLHKKAWEVMHKKIVSIRPDCTLAEAFKMIKNYDFSQLPVLSKGGTSVGAIYQKKLMEIAALNPDKMGQIRVREIIDVGLPQVDISTSIGKIRGLLEGWDAVLVTRANKVAGIITIYDVLKLL